ncbi:hypothetical protein E6C76_20080, partial [Pseudothauera nasutitermitis]
MSAPPPVPPAALSGTVRLSLDLTDAHGVAARLPHHRARALGAIGLASPHAEMQRARARGRAQAAQALPAASGARCPHADMRHTRRPVALRHAHGLARQSGAAL